MCEESSENTTPCFNSLAEIMEHFHRVPLEQFKCDLNNWFYKSLNEKKIDLARLNDESTPCFPETLKQFVEEIYKQAEVLKDKRDNRTD